MRSVSPVHLRYLHNMGMAASASISIIMDGGRWLAERDTIEPPATHSLAEVLPDAEDYADRASGTLALPVPEEQSMLIWLRSEQVEAARHLRRALRDASETRERQRLYRELERALADKDAALARNDILMKEVDHRVRNSLQLVSAFLSLQARHAGPGLVADQLIEARSRLSAVALVHRRCIAAIRTDRSTSPAISTR